VLWGTRSAAWWNIRLDTLLGGAEVVLGCRNTASKAALGMGAIIPVLWRPRLGALWEAKVELGCRNTARVFGSK
jgi:hypothetical protein